jgi:hypothetical protein
MARIASVRGETERFQRLLAEAINGIDSKSTADFVVEDLQYIMSPEDWARYSTLDGTADLRSYFAEFWSDRSRRDENSDAEVHFRRLLIAERDYAVRQAPGIQSVALHEVSNRNQPKFNRRIDEMGEVYVLYGEPDDRDESPGRATWTYRQPRRVFRFERSDPEVEWRLIRSSPP